MVIETINFISSTWFDWVPYKKLSVYRNCKFKLLSEKPLSGESTLMIKIPKNFIIKKDLSYNYDEEIFILDGSIEFSGNILNKDFYSYIPSGYPKKLFSSKNGAIGLIFLKKESNYKNKKNNLYPNFDHSKWIPRMNAFENIWPAPSKELKTVDLNFSGARIKILREDKITGSKTFLVGFPPIWSFPEVYNLSEDLEIFLINGNVNNSRGFMKSGSYLRIPQGDLISSMYSKESAVFLFKSSGKRILFKRTNNNNNNNNNNFNDIIKKNNSIIPKSILNKINYGPYLRIKK